MNLKICENNKELSDYIKYQVQGREEISVILSSDTLIDIIDELKSYGRTLRISSITTDSDSEEYLITKYLNEMDKECLVIEPLYQYNIETTEYEPIYVKDENVIIEEFTLEEDEIEDIVYSDEYQLLGLAEDHLELKEERKCNCCGCEGCASSCCYEDYKDNKDDLGDEIEEYLTEKIMDYYNDEIDLRNLLRNIYSVAFEDGFNSSLLSMRDSIDKCLEY